MNIGITLMIVGMITVFVILLIIIQLSNLLIKIVNKVAPEEDVKPAKTAARVMPIAPDVAMALGFTQCKKEQIASPEVFVRVLGNDIAEQYEGEEVRYGHERIEHVCQCPHGVQVDY